MSVVDYLDRPRPYSEGVLRMPSIFTTVVPPDGRGMSRANAERLRGARAVLERAHVDGISLVVFPAGFLSAKDERGAESSSLLEMAARLGVAIIFGVDTQPPSEKNSGDLVARGCLPFFVVAQSMDEGPYFWRQRSTTTANGHDVPEPPTRRKLRVARQDIDVLACGEVFNHRFRDELGPWTDRIVVAPSHTARGARFFRAREWAASAGIRAMLRAVHSQSPLTQTGADTVGRIDETTIYRWQ